VNGGILALKEGKNFDVNLLNNTLINCGTLKEERKEL
jgi:hypothetical protein